MWTEGGDWEVIVWEVIGFNGTGLERCCGIWRGGNTNQSMLMTVLNQNFEELMTHANVLNRKLEEVHGVGKEFSTVAELWGVSRSYSSPRFRPVPLPVGHAQSLTHHSGSTLS
jgi:hypothetical protein